MDDQSQTPKIASAIVTLLTIVFAYGFVHANLQSPRPYSQTASSHVPDTEDSHRVESRLWQDPFESFETSSNQTDVAGKDLSRALRGDWTNSTHQLLWDDIKDRASKAPVAILGVMMEGGSYPQNKEVRLRIRYAVELALLTQDVGPQDSTHIYTNSVWLNRADVITNISVGTNTSYVTNSVQKDSRLSQYAYEWFRTGNRTTNTQVCVLWLNEDDFADNPALRLGTLLTNIPALTNADENRRASFYLIGPRASDTLQALAYTVATNLPGDLYTNLLTVSKINHFNILSPEATAPVVLSDLRNPNGPALSKKLKAVFHENVFHNWIAPDVRIADLISKELTNRLDSTKANPDNIVVLLSEQDTYYGRRLADALTDALVTNHVCADPNHVWQFSYLRGLDGSKPQAEAQDLAPVLAATPEEALQTAMGQQQGGARADGDSQLDYLIRMGEFLKKKDDKLKEETKGRIIAIGFTGSDTYDKLILLQELRSKFPEAVFFTSDLDASLWTSKELKYTRNVIVGSAYSVNPVIDERVPQHVAFEEFAPFRDVYQAAVFRACSAVADYEKGDPLAGLDPTNEMTNGLYGKLYIIGRHGPVTLKTDSTIKSPEYDAKSKRWLILPLSLVALGAVLVYWLAGSKAGIYWGWKRPVTRASIPGRQIREAMNKEIHRQIDLRFLLELAGALFLIGIAVGTFVHYMFLDGDTPGEEPLNFNGGISIWPSESIRLLALVIGVIFIYSAHQRRREYLKLLWERYFSRCEPTNENWNRFYNKSKAIAKGTVLRSLFGRGLAGKFGYRITPQDNASFIKAWIPPFIQVSSQASIHARELFKGYLHVSHWTGRVGRIVFCILVYALLVFPVTFFLNDPPMLLLIRGHLSHLFDEWVLGFAILTNLVVLFYVFDRTILTKRVLDYINRYPTHWPLATLSKHTAKFGVIPSHLDGLLDVDFAAFQTAEISPMLSVPIILQLLLLISRDCWFDDWTWPAMLVLIFAMNFLIAIGCWWVVRHSAERVRQDALGRLEESESVVRNSPGVFFLGVSKKIYLKNLETIRGKIERERSGAFAKWFQDPAYIAVFIPSGATGIISLLSPFLFNR